MTHLSDTTYDEDEDTLVQEEKPKLKRPPMYKVVLLNDDYTPMDFVVSVLEIFFLHEPRASESYHVTSTH